jgi:hypothetical protein
VTGVTCAAPVRLSALDVPVADELARVESAPLLWVPQPIATAAAGATAQAAAIRRRQKRNTGILSTREDARNA